MITDFCTQIDRYAPVHPRFPAAFAFLKQLLANPNLENGRYPMNPESPDEVFANVQSYVTKPFSEGFFETHKTYIDLQFIWEGEELIYTPTVATENLEQTSPYQAERDAAFYRLSADGENFRLKVPAGMFVILLPGEVHAPSIRTGSVGANVRKIVLKIKA